MFAGGEKIRINVLPSQLFDFVRSEKSAEGTKITDEEVASLRAVVDGYQNGKLYVSSRLRDDLEMESIRRINTAIEGRNGGRVNTYEAGSYDLNMHRRRLTTGTIALGAAGGLLAVGVTAISLPVGPPLLFVGVLGSAFGGLTTHFSDKQFPRELFPTTISKPDDNCNNDDTSLPFWGL